MYTRKGCIPIEFDDWTQYHEMGPKTVALLLWAYLEKESTIPVDSHVYLFMKLLSLTNAKLEDECSWQMKKYSPKGSFIRINNSIGGIGQTMATPRGRRRVMDVTIRIAPKPLQQSMMAVRDVYANKGNRR